MMSLTGVDAKNLTNADINRLQSQQNKGVPTYKGKDAHSSSSVPGIPPASGVPAIPPPSGTPGVPVVPGVSGVPTVPGVASGAVQGAVVVKKHLPMEQWQDQYRGYFQKHYRDDRLEMTPRLIVMHYSGTEDFARLWWTFVNGGAEGNLSVHFVVDKDGTIYELVPPEVRARGTYGVNHVAISVDLIGRNENEILKNERQLKVSFALVRFLMGRYNIPKEKVLGHYEVAKGKDLVPEYLDFADARYPDRYPPGSTGRGPGRAYMFKLRYYLNE